jgi:peptidoglycan/xylan/chitin deacetylase (PgdA/CDA1 family)
MRSLLSAYPERITFVGKVPSLVPYFDNSSCVVAAGRTAVEALMRGIPTVALGESCLEGLMTMDNRAACLYSNLGDILPERHAIQIDMARLTQDLHKAVALQKNPDILTQFYNEAFCLETVYQNVMEVYLSARMKKAYAKHIPILMYHKVLPEIEKSQHRTSVTIAQFESHCRLIKRFGYTPITFEDYDAFRNGKKSLSQFPKKPIILTFDDGYVDNETYALPILQQYGFKAVLYVLGDFNIDHNQWDTREGEPRQALLSSAAIKALSDSGVFEIGAHGLRHDSLPTLSAIKAYNDITQSKKNIETLLGKTLLSFAYPYGDYNEAIKAQVKEAGFLYAVATDHGGLHIEDDHFEIFRVNILPRDKGIHFLKKIQSWYRGRYFRRRGH